MSKELEDWLKEEKTEYGLETAMEMLKCGLSFDIIAKCTKLPLQVIETLARQHKLA